jgi:hypothetical protein
VTPPLFPFCLLTIVAARIGRLISALRDAWIPHTLPVGRRDADELPD